MKPWQKHIRSFVQSTQNFITGLPKDTPDSFRQSLGALNQPVTLLLGKLPESPDGDAAMTDEQAQHVGEILTNQATIIAGIPKLVADERQAAVVAAVNAGTHLAKDAVDALVKSAREDGEKKAREGFELQTKRQTILAGAGLPTAIDAKLLTGEENAFAEAQKEATRRAGVLKTEGVDLPDGKEKIRLLFGVSGEEFESQVVLFKSLLGKSGKGGKGGGAGHPLKTGSGDDGKEPKGDKVLVC